MIQYDSVYLNQGWFLHNITNGILVNFSWVWLMLFYVTIYLFFTIYQYMHVYSNQKKMFQHSVSIWLRQIIHNQLLELLGIPYTALLTLLLDFRLSNNLFSSSKGFITFNRLKMLKLLLCFISLDTFLLPSISIEHNHIHIYHKVNRVYYGDSGVLNFIIYTVKYLHN